MHVYYHEKIAFESSPHKFNMANYLFESNQRGKSEKIALQVCGIIIGNLSLYILLQKKYHILYQEDSNVDYVPEQLRALEPFMPKFSIVN